MDVVPRAGTWIEIIELPLTEPGRYVVPRAGTWIEMAYVPLIPARGTSCPVRARGLK